MYIHLMKYTGQNIKPFESYKAYGPYLDTRGGRYIIALRNPESGHSSISFARFLMSVALGRVLGSHEEVDHINGDRTDDRVENLQIVSGPENRTKSLKERKVTRRELLLRCPGCESTFQKRKNVTHLSKGGTFTSCSRTCRAQVLRMLANPATHEEIKGRIAGNVIGEVEILSG